VSKARRKTPPSREGRWLLVFLTPGKDHKFCSTRCYRARPRRPAPTTTWSSRSQPYRARASAEFKAFQGPSTARAGAIAPGGGCSRSIRTAGTGLESSAYLPGAIPVPDPIRLSLLKATARRATGRSAETQLPMPTADNRSIFRLRDAPRPSLRKSVTRSAPRLFSPAWKNADRLTWRRFSRTSAWVRVSWGTAGYLEARQESAARRHRRCGSSNESNVGFRGKNAHKKKTDRAMAGGL